MSTYAVTLSEVTVLPVEESRKKVWKVLTRCFGINWSNGLQQLAVGLESKLKAFCKTKVSECTTYSG